MKLRELTIFLDRVIPLSFQESYDNSGLQTGSPDKEISSALLTLDVTEDVLDEAGYNGCDVIISHHPVIFGGLKQLTGKTAAERIILKAVRQDIAIYSAHTNLDAVNGGVSMKMAEKLKLENIRVLVPLQNKLMKLVTFIPAKHFEKVTSALFEAGAGVIGNYDRCGFSVPGTGIFRAGEGTDPFAGEKGKDHQEQEVRFETILYSHLKSRVLKALYEAHPYEEPAFDFYMLDNDNYMAGMGCTGELAVEAGEMEFLEMLKNVFNPAHIRYSRLRGRKIRKVALCGGAGGQLIGDAIASGSDVYVTGDIRYHSFLDSGSNILLADIGHFESEKYSPEILYDLIIKKFPTFALRFSDVNTNPINFL